MKTDAMPATPAPTTLSPAARAAQVLLDDLRLIHRAETVNVAGHGLVDVCATCHSGAGAELYPCPTLRIARRHARMAGAR